MTSRERFVTALNGGTPDRVPVFDFLFSPRLQKELLGYATELFDGESQVKLAALLGLDAQVIPINGHCGFEDEPHSVGSSYKDEWGVTYVKNGWPIMLQTDVPIKSRQDWENYRMPDPRTPLRTRMIQDAVRANEPEIAVIAGFLGPFTMAYWYLTDLATLSLLVYDDPALIDEMNAAYVKWALESVRIAYDEGGIDAFALADDWGGSAGLLMSPFQLRRFFVKPFTEIVQGMRRFGVPVMMHNDGNLWEVMDDLVASGINAFHPVERAAGMDLAKIKARYGPTLCPIGNINNKTTMVSGTPEDVRREALECLRIAAPGGGYVLATDHSLHDDIPLANIRSYIEVAHEFGTYPLSLDGKT
jgi:uroporphyrinogen decarboxylase